MSVVISSKDILINARQESLRMRHHYLGVEHLFIAMLQIQGGITASIIEEYGFKPEYIIDAIRRKTVKGGNQRLWAGFPYTPRTEVVLDIAKDIALENENQEVTERELLVAIISENDSLPVRVLKAMGVNLKAFTLAAMGYDPKREPQPPDITITFGETFAPDNRIEREQLFVLRKMFASHHSIRVEQRLTGFSGALVLVVTPIHADGRQDAPIVVKIHDVDSILDEVHRYEIHVKSALPLQTARLEDMPVAPETSDLAGIKYTLVANADGIPLDLRSYAQIQGPKMLAQILHQELYEQFKITWWQQRRPFRFQVWKEYDWLLPPLLTLDFIPETEEPDNPLVLKVPVNRAKVKAKLQQLEFGDDVVIENFTVQKVDRQNNLLKLAVGFGSEADRRAYKIEMRGVNRISKPFFRGEVVERLIGTVWKTRQDILLENARDLIPDFDLTARWINVNDHQLPNPLLYYDDLLDRYVNGSMSKIHGDLHLGNILVGPNNSTWLIDFGHTRDGHALFDWATLEVSILGDVLMSLIGDEWGTVKQIVVNLLKLNAGHDPNESDPMITEAMTSIAAIRKVIHDCLLVESNWLEYYTAIAFAAIRGIGWSSMPLGGRRLMFLVSAMAIYELMGRFRNHSGSDSPSPEHTDVTDHLSNPVPDPSRPQD